MVAAFLIGILSGILRFTEKKMTVPVRVRGIPTSKNPIPPEIKSKITLIRKVKMFSVRLGSRYAAPAATTGTLLALSLLPATVEAKVC